MDVDGGMCPDRRTLSEKPDTSGKAALPGIEGDLSLCLSGNPEAFIGLICDF